jgi:hypothetical protein
VLPTASAIAAPSQLLPPTLAWKVLLKTGGQAGVTGAVATTDAYIAYGSGETGSWASRSTDGQAWNSTPLSIMVKPCPTYGSTPDATVSSGATDGRQVVLVGIEYAMEAVPCGTYTAVAWISTDGKSWQRSQGFGAVDGFAEATEVWSVPGGWEALVGTSSSTGTRSIWASADGLQWHQVHTSAAAPDSDISATFAAAANGTRLLAESNGPAALQTSTDGVRWSPVALTLPNGGRVVAGGIRAPGLVGPDQWLLLTAAESQPTIVWVSSDLVTWRHAPFPRGDIGLLAVTRYGYLMTGADLCGDGGDACSPKLRDYFSADGLHWTPFTTATAYDVVVDGPVGVIGLSGGPIIGVFGT